MATRIVVVGASGRMGRALAGLIAGASDLELVGGLDRSGRGAEDARGAGYPVILPLTEGEDILAAADVVLDFSTPEATRTLASELAGSIAGRAVVIGTTGLGADETAAIDALARRAAVLVAANFSVGVNLLLELVERAARALPASGYDVEIVETHHRAKVDAPSGTALAIGRAVAVGREAELGRVRRDGRSGPSGPRPEGEVAFHSLRGGGVVGEHRVLFLGGRERVELAHAADDRALFAEGALVAARWLAGKAPGRYGMNQVLGL